MKINLEGRIALVTGASGELGRVMARMSFEPPAAPSSAADWLAAYFSS